MPNVINKLVVRELQSSFHDADGMVFIAAGGLTVAETESLRVALGERGTRLQMLRNRLARIALAERGLEAPGNYFKGNVAAVWGSVEETIAAAKVFKTSDLFKKTNKIVFAGGLLEGKLLEPKEAEALADLPGRDELRAMLLGVIAGPARSLVTVIAAPGASLARVLQARVDKQEGGSDAA